MNHSNALEMGEIVLKIHRFFGIPALPILVLSAVLLVASVSLAADPLTVTGTDATYTVSGNETKADVISGDQNGEAGTLILSDGATLNSDSSGNGGAIIGNQQGSTGSVLMSGTGTNWTESSNQIIVGRSGTGTLTLSDGATINANGLHLGYSDNGQGTVTLTGTDTQITSALSVTLGFGSTGANGSLTISNGASLETQGPNAGLYIRSDSTIDISGSGSSLRVGTTTPGTPAGWGASEGWLSIGYGSVTVSDGAYLETDGTYLSGHSSGEGRLTLTGSDTVLDAHLVLYVGGDTGGNGGDAVLTMSDGATATANVVSLGNDAGTTGTILLDGEDTSLSSISEVFSGNFYIGWSGDGIATVRNGASLSAANVMTIAGQAASVGKLIIGADAGQTASTPGSVSIANGITFGPGTGFVIFNHTSDSYAFDEAFSGTGTIRNIAGTTNLSGTSAGFTGSLAIEGGTLLANGDLSSATTTVGSGATLGGTGPVGALTVNSGGIHSPGNSVGTQTVNGIYTLDADSTYEVEVEDGSSMDQVVATGGASLNGATLSLVSLGGTWGDDSYSQTIIDNQSANAVTGTFGTVSESFAFYDASVDYTGGTGNDVVLTLTRNSTSLADVAATSNQAAVAGALSSQSGDDSLANTILSMTQEQAQDTFSQLSGDIYPSTGQVNRNLSHQVGQKVSRRLANLRAGDGNPGSRALSLSVDEMAEIAVTPSKINGLLLDARLYASENPDAAHFRHGIWSQAMAGTSDIDASENSVETTYDWGGLISGYDTQIMPDLTMGSFLGHIWGQNEQSAISSKVDTNTLVAGLYGEYRMGQWQANARLSYNRISTESTRNLSISGTDSTASADYVDHALSIEGEISRAFQLQDNLWVEPYLGAGVLQQFLDDFDETGAGSANLARDSDDVLTGNTEAGLRLAADIPIRESFTLMPQLGIAWRHHIGPRANGSTLHFAGGSSSFVVQGTPEDRNAFSATVGSAATFGGHWRAFAIYGHTASPSQSEHSIVLGGRYEW